MLAHDGNSEGLFHGAFMQSGAPIPVGNITGGQPYYNHLVNVTGCTGQQDTLSCLRSAPLSTLSQAINQTPGLFAYQVRIIFCSTVDEFAEPENVVADPRLASKGRWGLFNR